MPAKDPALKGKKDGNCNRTACQAPGAVWYHTGTMAYYCRYCAATIQRFENDCAEAENREPIIMFEGIFDRNDPRHQR